MSSLEDAGRVHGAPVAMLVLEVGETVEDGFGNAALSGCVDNEMEVRMQPGGDRGMDIFVANELKGVIMQPAARLLHGICSKAHLTITPVAVKTDLEFMVAAIFASDYVGAILLEAIRDAYNEGHYGCGLILNAVRKPWRGTEVEDIHIEPNVGDGVLEELNVLRQPCVEEVKKAMLSRNGAESVARPSAAAPPPPSAPIAPIAPHVARSRPPASVSSAPAAPTAPAPQRTPASVSSAPASPTAPAPQRTLTTQRAPQAPAMTVPAHGDVARSTDMPPSAEGTAMQRPKAKTKAKSAGVQDMRPTALGILRDPTMQVRSNPHFITSKVIFAENVHRNNRFQHPFHKCIRLRASLRERMSKATPTRQIHLVHIDTDNKVRLHISSNMGWSVKINETELPLSVYPKPPRGTKAANPFVVPNAMDLSPYLLGADTVKVEITPPIHTTPGLVCMAVVQVLQTDALVDRVRARLGMSHTRVGDDSFDDIIQVNCPLSMIPVEIAARGKDCKHARVFDLRAYLQYSSKFQVWMCPCCNTPCPYTSLRVDKTLCDFLEASAKQIEDAQATVVYRHPSGEFSLQPSQQQEGGDENENIVLIDDLDDDTAPPPQKRSNTAVAPPTSIMRPAHRETEAAAGQMDDNGVIDLC